MDDFYHHTQRYQPGQTYIHPQMQQPGHASSMAMFYDYQPWQEPEKEGTATAFHDEEVRRKTRQYSSAFYRYSGINSNLFTEQALTPVFTTPVSRDVYLSALEVHLSGNLPSSQTAYLPSRDAPYGKKNAALKWCCTGLWYRKCVITVTSYQFRSVLNHRQIHCMRKSLLGIIVKKIKLRKTGPLFWESISVGDEWNLAIFRELWRQV